MKILIDMDGVIANIMPLWLKWYNRDYHDNLKEEDVTDWSIERIVKPECGTRMMHYLGYEGFFRNAVPYPEAKEVIQRLLDLGAEIWFVTKSTHYGRYMVREKSEWIAEHYPHIGQEKILFCKYKSVIPGDLMVDDYFQNLRGFNGIKVLFERPWNRNVAVDHFLSDGNKALFIKTGSWSDIVGVAASIHRQIIPDCCSQYSALH